MDTIVDWERETPQWSAVLAAAGNCGETEAGTGNSLWPLYGPLVQMPQDQNFVIGQIGQSLDGRIATASGHSHYINGEAALIHLHRLRAVVDAVVVGVGTVVADDPQLTVRRAASAPHRAQPARVIIDLRGRMPRHAKCLRDDGALRIVFGPAKANSGNGVEYIDVPSPGEGLAPEGILAALAQRGLHRVLVEGGAMTLSRFLQARCLDRLHIMTGPLIIGSGKPGLQLAEIATLDGALRPAVRSFALPGGDVLFDCAFSKPV